MGTPDLFQINQGIPRVSFLTQQTSGYAQDTMRVLPDLGVTLGLRYDWQQKLDDRKNLAPRFWLAYAPGKRKRTVIRAGAGMFTIICPVPPQRTRCSLMVCALKRSTFPIRPIRIHSSLAN